MTGLMTAIEASCESEWTSRSLTQLAGHLSAHYRYPTQKRLNTICELLSQPTSPGHAHEATYSRLITAFHALRLHVESHMRIEDDLLFPLVAAVEHPQVLRVRSSCQAARQLVMRAIDGHKEILRLVDELKRAVRAMLSSSSSLPPETVPLLQAMATLWVLLLQQVDLEDRCLWPRALRLFCELP